MGVGPGMFDGIEKLFFILAVLFPLGVWKLVEIIVWLFTHVSIAW